MPVLSTNVLTLEDWAKRLDPDGKTATVVELLSQTNEMLDDMLWKEGNLPTGHRSTIRTGLPTVYWRMLNQGVPPSKSTTAQVDDQCGMLDAWSEVDVKLAKLNGNVNEFRASEGMAFIESMNQEMQGTVIYGNGGLAPEEFTGLAPRFSSIVGAANRSNVISGGGTGSDNASIWLIGWGDKVHGIFPKGSKAGLDHQDYGEVTVETTAAVGGSRMRALQEHWTWDAGIVVGDWRNVVRICNIDVSDLVAMASNADLIDLMIRAYHRLPSLNLVRPVFYMNRTLAQGLDMIAKGDVGAGGGLTFENVAGKRIANFRGIPIRIVDQLLETEATVV